MFPRPIAGGVEFLTEADGTQRAARLLVDIAIDVQFEPSDAFRATVLQASQPLVLEPPPMQQAPMLPPAQVAHALPARRTVYWPLLLCGFVAVTCATIAFLKSPLAQHPFVAPYANALLAQI